MQQAPIRWNATKIDDRKTGTDDRKSPTIESDSPPSTLSYVYDKQPPASETVPNY